MFTEHAFHSGEVQLNYAVGGSAGSPLLLLHGLTRRWQDYLTLTPSLSPRWHIHALDFRGHGRSARSPGRYRVMDYVGDALAMLRTQINEPAVIYGHSLGSLVAAAVAAEAPDLVRAVVLEDPPSIPHIHQIKATPFYAFFSVIHSFAGRKEPVGELTKQLADARVPGPDGREVRMGDVRDITTIRFSARCLQQLDPGTLRALLDGGWLDGYEFDAICRKIACPALLLRGNEALGGMLPRDDAQRAAGLMADCNLLEIADTGHLIHLLRTELTARVVMEFLESL